VTDADGSFDFAVPLNADALPRNITKLLVHAVAVDFPANETSKMKQPFNKLHVGLTHSNLTSALTVQGSILRNSISAEKISDNFLSY
jgi:hypothetical protein